MDPGPLLENSVLTTLLSNFAFSGSTARADMSRPAVTFSFAIVPGRATSATFAMVSCKSFALSCAPVPTLVASVEFMLLWSLLPTLACDRPVFLLGSITTPASKTGGVLPFKLSLLFVPILKLIVHMNVSCKIFFTIKKLEYFFICDFLTPVIRNKSFNFAAAERLAVPCVTAIVCAGAAIVSAK